jgi:hypothetical protein
MLKPAVEPMLLRFAACSAQQRPKSGIAVGALSVDACKRYGSPCCRGVHGAARSTESVPDFLR